MLEEHKLKKDSNCDFDNTVRGSNNWLQLEFDFDKEWNRTSRVISLKNLDYIAMMSNVDLEE